MENRLSFLPTRDLVIYPGIVFPVYVGREKSIKSLEKIISGEQNKMLFAMQKDTLKEDPKLPEDVYTAGMLVHVLQATKMPNKTVKLMVEGKARVIIENPREEKEGGYTAGYTVVEPTNGDKKETHAIYRKALEYYEQYTKFAAKVLPEVFVTLKSTKDLSGGLDLMADNMFLETDEKQLVLEKSDVEERGLALVEILSRELELHEIEKKVEDKVKNKMNDAQRAYYLKEKINALKEEIQDYTPEDEDSDLAERIEKAKLPSEVKKKVDEELKKMSKMPPFSAEASVSRNYIETLLELPWKKTTKDDLNIERAASVLDRDHYGLKEVKDRILDYLAVKKLNPKMKGTIICLVGPPGVGKTSLAKSVADSLGRKFVRVSLGGVRDEAEIRGHRRTYIGSMPGRIMKAMKLAGVKNPLILLDELDKMSSDFKGDPASAMLEVLDPEQNIHFEDHYIDTPFDLSEVFFLATANDLRNIPEPLIDRMEIITLSSYTEYEKLHIAKQYLVKQLQEENGLNKIKITLSDNVILKIINEYTREAGVRNLKREINNLFRKLARKVVKENLEKVTVNVNNLEKYLGKAKFRPEKLKEKTYKVGIVNGLAWTAVGGVTLEVQGVLIPGKGTLNLTGTLGNVMKESAEVAFTYIKSNFDRYKINAKEFMENKNIHLHFPEGATPKDGPSAGITITTAILSVLTGREIRQDIAMTGEITITGEVLAIGGVKEKVIGAHRAGIREVILPEDNRPDITDIPHEVAKDMKIDFVKSYDEVENLVFKK